MRELLREGSHGIRDRLTALELTTYVRNDRGRHVPEAEAFSDLLMAYMGAQLVAKQTPLRPYKRRASGPAASYAPAPRRRRTGY